MSQRRSVTHPNSATYSTSQADTASLDVSETIELTIKSLKPALSFKLSVPSTTSVGAAKALLSASDTSAPAPEAQRWILKGKAMGDSKLIKEFAIVDGAATVNLMLAKPASGTVTPPVLDLPTTPAAAEPAPAPSGPDPLSLGPIPALTLSTDPIPSPSNPTAPKLSITTNIGEGTDFLPPSAPLNGESEAFTSTIGDPELWIETYAMLLRRFGNDERGEREAKKVWEAWLMGARSWIEPGTKALIRERCGISAMGGEA